MKRIFNMLTVVAGVSFLFTSCLKDDAITDYSDQSIQPVVLIPNANWPRTVTVAPLALDFVPKVDVSLTARVSWDKPLDQAVEVTFAKDAAAVTQYNAKFGTTYEFLPDNAWKASSFKTTIPAGATDATLPIEIYPPNIDLAKNNMIAFKITDASGQNVASNFSTFLKPILVKNIYEANYAVTGWFFHPSAPRGINADKYIATISGVRSEAPLGDLGGAGYIFRFDVSSTNTLINWQAMESTPTEPASGFMTLDNPAGIPTYPGPGGYTHATYNNTYDPDGKVFWMHYGYGVGSTGQSGYTRQVYEKWTRK
jgi:Domain of unknown function (DUF1735)